MINDTSNKFVYHRKSPSFKGDYLYSLNQLKDIYPAAYQQSLKKYKGRESQVNQPIPGFEFSWNDLIHIAPISPKLITEGLLKAGRKYEDLKHSIWFKIPVALLKDKKVIWYKYSGKPNTRTDQLVAEEFEEFSFEKYQEMTLVPDQTLNYYKSKIKEDQPLLLFHLIPHILVESPIDIRGLEVIEV